MVLTHRVGSQRPFPIVLLLYVLSFGLYGAYWHYRVHDEVYRQFGLDQERKENGFGWLLYGYVLFRPLLWIYQWIMINNVRHVRERMGFARTLRVGPFLSLNIGGSVLFFGALLFFYVATTVGAGEDETLPIGTALLSAGGAFLIWVSGAAMQATAFGLLQRDVNALWRAYDVRLAELMPPTMYQPPNAAAPAPPAPPASLAPATALPPRPDDDQARRFTP